MLFPERGDSSLSLNKSFSREKTLERKVHQVMKPSAKATNCSVVGLSWGEREMREISCSSLDWKIFDWPIYHFMLHRK